MVGAKLRLPPEPDVHPPPPGVHPPGAESSSSNDDDDDSPNTKSTTSCEEDRGDAAPQTPRAQAPDAAAVVTSASRERDGPRAPLLGKQRSQQQQPEEMEEDGKAWRADVVTFTAPLHFNAGNAIPPPEFHAACPAGFGFLVETRRCVPYPPRISRLPSLPRFCPLRIPWV